MSDCVWCKCSELSQDVIVTETPQTIESYVKFDFTPHSEGVVDFSITIDNPEITLTGSTIDQIGNYYEKGTDDVFSENLTGQPASLTVNYTGKPLNTTTLKIIVSQNNREIITRYFTVTPQISYSETKEYPRDICDRLKEENKEKVREFAIIYRDLQTCNLAEYGAKGFYNIWCLMDKMISFMCSLNKVEPTKPKSVKAGKGISVSETGESYIVSSNVTVPKIVAGSGIQVTSNGDSTTISTTPQKVDLSGYVPKSEYDKVKKALDKIIENLTNSGAWSGGIEGGFNQGRNIATGNINIFGGTPDGNSFIRTNNGRTENDLAGGI